MTFFQFIVIPSRDFSLPLLLNLQMSTSGISINNYSPFQYRVKNHAFHRWMIFTPLWRTIKNSGRAGSEQDDRLEKIIRKWKMNKNLKMQSFCAVFDFQIVLTEKKTTLINVFPKMLKIMAKKAWNFRKWEEKSSLLAQIFRKYLT